MLSTPNTPPEIETPVTSPEIETPVTSPEIETPASPPEIPGASLTSHLGFAAGSIRRAEESREAAAAMQTEMSDDLQGLKLPATLAESLALNAKIRDEEPKDNRFVAIRKARLAKLAKHIHALSQGATAPAVDHRALKRTPPASALARVAEMYSKSKAKRN